MDTTLKRDSVKRAAATEIHEATAANSITTEGMELLLVVRTSSSLATMMDATMQRAPIYCHLDILRFKMN